MKYLGLLVMLLWTTTSTRSLPTNEVIVSEELSACEDKGRVLFCDFRNNQQETVYMKSLKSKAIEHVFIYSASRLIISDESCVNNITLHNVKGATVTKSNTDLCELKFQLTASKSEFSLIQSDVTKLKLEDCKVETLTTGNELSELTIINSQVNTMNVSENLVPGSRVTIQESQIQSIEEMVINSESSVLIQSTTIGNIKPKGLRITVGNLTVKDSSIERATTGNWVLEHFQGSMTLSPYSEGDTKRNGEFFKTDGNICECEGNTYSILFYISLVLLLLSWGFFFYLNKDKIMKRKNSHGEIQPAPGAEEKELLENKEKEASGKGEESESSKKIVTISGHLNNLKDMLDTVQSNHDKGNEIQELSSPEQNDYLHFLTTLQHLQQKIIESLGKLESIKKIEENVKSLLQSTNQSINENNICRSDFFKDVESIFQINSVSESELHFFADAVQGSENELAGKFSHIGKPKTPKHLLTEAKNIENQNKKNKANNLYYIVPASLFDSFLHEMSKIQTQSFQHYQMSITKNLHYREKVLILLLKFYIFLLNLVLKDAKKNK